MALSLAPAIVDILEMEYHVKVSCVVVNYFCYHDYTPSDIDECVLNPCGTNAVCEDTPGSFNCACSDGYIGDGIICQSNFLC